jgi:inositol transport system ATP-binding protein
MSIAENIFLGREPSGKFFGTVDKKEMNRRTEELLDKVGLKLEPECLMKDLSVAERQMVEIAKAISYGSDIIIMDEPTSAISDKEVDRLFSIIDNLKGNNVAIIYISHKMEEIFRIADDITVLRDGNYIGTYKAEELNTDKLILLMVGRELKEIFLDRVPNIGEEMLAVKNLCKEGVFRDISFSVRKGEVLGIAGLMGAGRTEVMRCIYGLDRYDSGEIFIKGEKVDIKNPSDAIKAGIGLINEDRKGVGLVLTMSVKHNLTLSNLNLYFSGQYISKSKETSIVDDKIQQLSIKTPSREQKIKNLSGGNQQKVVIGKTLLDQSEILILDEPTRGIDVGSKAEIYKLISELANRGKAIIMVSSEMPELLGMCDRIIVLHEGHITGELSNRTEFAQEKVMKYALGN